ncbi:hypothetical protein INT45_007073 [Circinella minor]|uniref:Uncharacterized protein n=1 Tax=Circinella minor TaxID=1195481 RepID=A0A8H7SAK8_9FUNG|nr:hypothetical protein INT45_007073 [Circinella minor]
MSVIPKTLSTNRTINKESTISLTTAIDFSAMESSLYEAIRAFPNWEQLILYLIHGIRAKKLIIDAQVDLLVMTKTMGATKAAVVRSIANL